MAVPITTVGSEYVNHQQAALLASITKEPLVRQLTNLDMCNQPCFAGVEAPTHSLLLVAQPARTSCTEVRSVNARLLDATDLSLVFSLKACDPGPGGGSVPQAQDLLLAVPLADLPAHTHLAVIASSEGDLTYGLLPAAATVNLP